MLRLAACSTSSAAMPTPPSPASRATKLPLLPDTAIGPVWAELANALLAADGPRAEVLQGLHRGDGLGRACLHHHPLPAGPAVRRWPRSATGAALARTVPANRPAGSAAPNEQELPRAGAGGTGPRLHSLGQLPGSRGLARKQLSLYANGAEAPARAATPGRLPDSAGIGHAAEPARCLTAAELARKRSSPSSRS